MSCNGLCAPIECGRSSIPDSVGLPNDDELGICCFPAKHMVLRSKNKDGLDRNQDNVSGGETCIHADCCFSELAL